MKIVLTGLFLFISSFSYAQGTIDLPTSFTENGQKISLKAVVYKPQGQGKFPVAVINHGSTGLGNSPSSFSNVYASRSLASYFTEKGWAVVFLQRRGRGGSMGQYDEGFTSDRSGYSCDRAIVNSGISRGVSDIKAGLSALKADSSLNMNRVLLVGHSRGGVLSIAAANAQGVVGVINFVGGWWSERAERWCGSREESLAVNQAAFKRGAGFGKKSIWIYGNSDPFYTASFAEEFFKAYRTGGGNGSFHAISGNHSLPFQPSGWSALTDNFLSGLK